ncbi:MAG: hypothetical protein KJO42_04450 [Silicimonas sp.]|nr:hypothetical protein [Silicimonas sp.]NNF90583.1 hypothetical protein [Boseongicola sp.]RZV99254.1 MAG: hypothetical protein EX266_15415 [Paracoccaceae bacterium]NND19975.1 hypothetical protein [Silicimonas sp.]NND21178.1 hypothetical protein [Silicimonas sp.]
MPESVKARLSLYGRFAFTASDDRDIAPKSAKAQALIALLATSDNGGRGRLWLQKRLWPNSPPEKAAISLRQALSEIRRAFGEDRDLLVSDRRSAALNLDRLDLVAPETGQEFLEGIGISGMDTGISDWLDKRRQSETVSSPAPMVAQSSILPARPIIVFGGRSDNGSELELVEDIFVDCVARSLRETLLVDVHLESSGVVPDHAFRVEVQAYRQANARVGLRARINQGNPTVLVWSGMTSTQLHGAPPVEDLEIVSLGNQLIDALADAMTLKIAETQSVRDANLLTRLAIRRVFCLRPDALVEADEMLARAQDMGARALTIAWRAQLRLIQHVELHPDRSENLSEEARAFCTEALELEPLNSMVLAAVANTRLVLDKDISACMELARRSVSLNPSNPLAWNSLATAKLYAGDIGEAHALAVRAQRMSSGSPFGHWWDFGRCLTAALTGRRDEAMQLAEAAHALSPEFRPPLRYLTALYAAAGRPDDAIRVGARLKKLEPGFSFERMATDEAYPISPLRWSGLLDAERLMELEER